MKIPEKILISRLPGRCNSFPLAFPDGLVEGGSRFTGVGDNQVMGHKSCIGLQGSPQGVQVILGKFVIAPGIYGDPVTGFMNVFAMSGIP